MTEVLKVIDPDEITTERTESGKVFDLGGGKRRLISHIGAIHYKNDYATDKDWLDIDLTWEVNRITKAPYELTRDGNKLTFRDKKTGEVSTLELLSVKPTGIPFEVIPHNLGVSFQHILPSDKVPFEAQFKVTGKFPITRAFDDEGEMELETTLVDGILTEKLSQVKDKITGQVRPAKGSIRIDPTLTVQPSGKDNFVVENAPTTNYGSNVLLITRQDNNAIPNEKIRSILEFDISGLPAGATLNTATLNLYYHTFISAPYVDPVDKTVWAYKLTRTDWVELEATWNIYKTGNNWTTAGGDYVTSNPSGGSTTFPASYGWMSWNTLAIVQDAYDSSVAAEFLVRFETETTDNRSNTRFHSNDYTADTSLCPKLVITYTEGATAQAVGGATASIAGALTKFTKTSIGGASLAIAGALSRATLRAVGGATATIAGTLVKKTSLTIGQASMAVSVALSTIFHDIVEAVKTRWHFPARSYDGTQADEIEGYGTAPDEIEGYGTPKPRYKFPSDYE